MRDAIVVVAAAATVPHAGGGDRRAPCDLLASPLRRPHPCSSVFRKRCLVLLLRIALLLLRFGRPGKGRGMGPTALPSLVKDGFLQYHLAF